MYKGRKFLAIITARGGSKGLKDKNIKSLNGKPLIAYTIEAATESNIFDKVIVSTDSEQIADVSREYGAEIPFIRPKELATDEAKSADVVLHALDYYKKQNENYDYFILLQPTSPLRTGEDLSNAADLILEKGGNSVVGVCEVEHSPLWTNELPRSLSLEGFLHKEIINTRRQDLPVYYRINGALYICKPEIFWASRDFFGDKSYAYIMTKEASVDIDDETDFLFAELLLKQRKNG